MKLPTKSQCKAILDKLNCGPEYFQQILYGQFAESLLVIMRRQYGKDISVDLVEIGDEIVIILRLTKGGKMAFLSKALDTQVDKDKSVIKLAKEYGDVLEKELDKAMDKELG